jgi:F0F1-type ATP synthase assembly protein I
MTPPKQQLPEEKKSFNDSLRQLSQYSSLGFQMLFVMLVGVLAGKQLDKYFPNERNWFTIAFSLFSVLASLIWIVYKLLNSQNNKN